MSTASLPKAIQKQLDDAAQIERAINGEKPSTEPVVQATPPAPAPAVETPPPAPAVPTETAPQPAPEVKEKPTDDAAYWRKRFDTVQGMLDVEARNRKELTQRLDDLQRQLQQREQPKPAPAPSLISEKDEEAFGTDLIDLARRAARDEFGRLYSSLIADVRKELTPVREQVGKVAEQQAMTAEERFFQVLNQAVPDWEQINTDTRWLTWLEGVDPLLGGPRQMALDDAHSRLDGARVAALFNTWKEQFAPKPPKDNQELARQVAPPKTGGGATTPSTPKVWTRAEYERAFDPRLAKTLDQEAIIALRADADRAAAEGRVRWA